MVYDRSLTQRFHRMTEELSVALKLAPRLGRSGQVMSLQWSQGDLVYDGPRFGASEVQSSEGGREVSTVAVVRGLKHAPAHMLEWVVWREAFLGLLPARIRVVREAADLGLYAGLRFGISDSGLRQELQRIWEEVSPPQTYELYSYQPTVGFALIDEVMDGAFLRAAVSWLNSLRGGSLQPMSSAAFTAALERWMMEVHCILNASEVRVLQELADRPAASQRQLAKRLQLSPAAISGVLKNLVRRHLLRVAGQLNFPLLGLYQVALDFRCPSAEKVYAVKARLRGHPYARLIAEFGNDHLITVMLVPVSRMERFRTWTERLSQALQVSHPSIHLVTEVIMARRFDSYEAKRGWTTEFWPLLLQIQRIIEGGTEMKPPPLRSFKYSIEEVRAGTVTPIRLQPEDFAWFEGSDRTIATTRKASAGIDEEIRRRGLSSSEAKRYRRRVQWLDTQGVRSPPLYVGLLHVGLDAELNVRLRSEPATVRRIVQACQLLPSVTGVFLDDGGALLSLLLPNAAAVDVHSLLRAVFGTCGIDASLALQPAWRAFGSHLSPLEASSYDFSEGTWIWSEPPI